MYIYVPFLLEELLPGPSIKFGAKVTREDFRLSEDPANVEQIRF